MRTSQWTAALTEEFAPINETRDERLLLGKYMKNTAPLIVARLGLVQRDQTFPGRFWIGLVAGWVDVGVGRGSE